MVIYNIAHTALLLPVKLFIYIIIHRPEQVIDYRSIDDTDSIFVIKESMANLLRDYNADYPAHSY